MIHIEYAAIEALYRLYIIAIENHNDGRIYSYDQASIFDPDFPTIVGEVPPEFRDGAFELLEDQKRIRNDGGTLVGHFWAITGKGITEIERGLQIEGSIPWSLDQQRSDTLSAIHDHIPTAAPLFRDKEDNEPNVHEASGDIQAGPASTSGQAEVVPAADRYVSVSDNQDAIDEIKPTLSQIRDEFAKDHFKHSNSAQETDQHRANIEAFFAQLDVGHIAKTVTDNLIATLRFVRKFALEIGLTAASIEFAIQTLTRLFS